MTSATREKVLVTWLFLLTLLCGVLAWKATAKPQVASYDELSVQRLNVVEPDGGLRFVISNKPRFPGLYMNGKEYPHPTRDTGGMLFFNSEGDEVGGLAFDGHRTQGGHEASAQLAFDQFEQDQTVAIQYNDDNGQRSAGLRVWDRPDAPLLPLIEMNATIAQAKSREEAQAIREKMLAYAKEHAMMPAERAFVGKVSDGSSVVKLSDKEGRARLVLSVDGAGNPSLKFLDEEGEVVAQLPEP